MSSYIDFTNALAKSNDYKKDPNWSDEVLKSLEVDTPEDLATFEQYLDQVVQSATSLTTQQFYDNWVAFVPSASSSGSSNDIAVYQKVFDTFFPGDEDHFVPEFSDFLFRMLKTGDAISPQGLVSQWFQRNTAFFLFDPTFVPNTYLESNNTEKVAIMNQIYNTIFNLVAIMQNLSIAQTSRLNFTGAYQQAYTKAIADIPQIMSGSPVSKFVQESALGFTYTVQGETIYVPTEAITTDGNGNQVVDLSLVKYPNPQMNPINATAFTQLIDENGKSYYVDALGNRVELSSAQAAIITAHQTHRSDIANANEQSVKTYQSYRSIATNQGSQELTNKGQTDQALNQMTNINTQLMKVMSRLLSSIFQ